MEESLTTEIPSANPIENPMVDALKSLESNLEIMEQRIQSDQLVEEHLNQVIKFQVLISLTQFNILSDESRL